MPTVAHRRPVWSLPLASALCYVRSVCGRFFWKLEPAGGGLHPKSPAAPWAGRLKTAATSPWAVGIPQPMSHLSCKWCLGSGQPTGCCPRCADPKGQTGRHCRNPTFWAHSAQTAPQGPGRTGHPAGQPVGGQLCPQTHTHTRDRHTHTRDTHHTHQGHIPHTPGMHTTHTRTDTHTPGTHTIHTHTS